MQKKKDKSGLSWNQVGTKSEYQKYKGTEDSLQKSVAQYLDTKKVLWCHPPNGGSRNIIEATKLKGMGVKSGVPDCLIFTQKKGYSGLAIELKVGYNKPSENQKDFIKGLEANGWLCVVSHSLDECIELIDWYVMQE
jgi:hypothetical protein